MNMLTTRRIARYFSTQRVVEKWFNALQARSHDEQQTKLVECIEYILQQNQINYSKLIQEIIHRWSLEQPSKEALWINETTNNLNQKLTFQDIYVQSTNLAHILTGKQFNLTTGANIMVILPSTVKECLLLQLACLQNNFNFSSLDSSNLNSQTICQQIQKSAVDCVITNEKHLEIVMKCTYNAMRPLKKGLITEHLQSQPLPVGWSPVVSNISSNEKKESSDILQPKTNSSTSLRSLLIAYWLNLKKPSRLIWIKNNHDQISFAPWLLGSAIFYKNTVDPQTITETLRNYPIDTVCVSKVDQQIFEKQTQCNILCTDSMIDSQIMDLNSNQTTLNYKNFH